jgi:hypothetical protein
MAGPNLTDREPHDKAEELLPWYATGQLDGRDRALVDEHLSSCAYCRKQLSIELQLIDEFQAMTPEVESGWARLRTRLERPAPARPPRRSPFADFWATLRRPAFAGFAAAQLAFVIIAGGALLSLSRPDYHALGSPPSPATGNVIVIFRADATEEEIRKVLDGAGASIVGGPTSADAFLLHVVPQHRRTALAKLRSDDSVQMAEAIDGGAS